MGGISSPVYIALEKLSSGLLKTKELGFYCGKNCSRALYPLNKSHSWKPLWGRRYRQICIFTGLVLVLA